jgi:hypothetical protein
VIGMPNGYPYTMRVNKEYNDGSFKYPDTVQLSEDDMVERVWAKAPPGSKLMINAFRIFILCPGSDIPIGLFRRAHLTRPWNLLADEDPWEFTQRLCELAYGKRDLFTEP